MVQPLLQQGHSEQAALGIQVAFEDWQEVRLQPL